jgi:O-antigen/teichoic acid export membrane protein
VRSLRPLLFGSFAKGAIAGVSTRVVGLLVLFVCQIALTRLMGAQLYGLYSLAVAVNLVVMIPGLLGNDTVRIKYVPIYLRQGRLRQLRRLLRHTNLVVAVASVLLSLLSLAVLALFTDRIPSPRMIVLALALATVPLSSMLLLQLAALRGAKRVISSLLPTDVIRPLFVVTAVLVAAHFLGAPARLLPLVGICAYAFSNGLISLVVFLRLPFMLATTPSHATANAAEVTESGRVWFNTGLSFVAFAALFQLLGQTDILTLGVLDTEDSVGVYAVCVSLASLVVFTQKAVELIAGPLLSERHASGEEEKFKLTILGTTVASMIGGLAVFLLLVVLGPKILSFYGPGFSRGLDALLILAGGLLVAASLGPGSIVLSMSGAHRQAAKFAGGTAAVNMIMNIIFVRLWSIEGAAAATGLSFILLAASQAAYVHKRYRINPTLTGIASLISSLRRTI